MVQHAADQNGVESPQRDDVGRREIDLNETDPDTARAQRPAALVDVDSDIVGSR
jgi:hypothetical protein